MNTAVGSEHNWRYHLLAVFFSAVSFLIIFQIFRIQSDPQAKKIREQSGIHKRSLHTFFPARGNIYDRYGHLLAGNQQVYNLEVDLYLVENPETIATVLSRVLANHVEYKNPDYYDRVYRIASTQSITGPTSITVAKNVTEAELAQIKEAAQRLAVLPKKKGKNVIQPSLRGLVYIPRLQRVYPEGELASPVLGFVNFDGDGVYGVEEKFNDLLAGKSQTVWVNIDPYKAGQLPQIPSGADLILTIDREVQAVVERILDQALVSSGSEAGTILVMNPRNGDILAMASTPRMNLNRFWEYGSILNSSVPFNRAVSKVYEPGSVFKVLTMAAALDSKTVTPDTVFVDTGRIEIGGIFINNWNWGAWGPQTMLGCMQHSLNVCLTWVAKQMGSEIFYDYMQRFGIGQLTGVDIAGEVPGRLKRPGDQDWYESDLGTNSFGQGVAVTPVQMAMAVSAVANNGVMVPPHVLKSLISNDRQFTPTYPAVGNPISAETARMLTEMLATSLEGESSVALVPGYRVAGKTGTAEIPTAGGYTSSLTNASFVGWGPVDDPQILIYVWLEKPTTAPWGSVVAAPVFSEVFKEVARLTNLPPDDVRRHLSGQ